MAVTHDQELLATFHAGRSEWTQRSAIWALIALVSTAIGVRGYRLADHCLWFDEAWSWRYTRFSIWEIIRRTAGDVHPPFYFLLLKGWVGAFGDSTTALRSLSVLCGGLTVLGMYLFVAEAFAQKQRGEKNRTNRLPARSLGLFTASLVTFSVFHIRYGWETRAYTLGTALLAFSSWALFRALRKDSDGMRWWVLVAILDLLFLYSHPYALFSMVAQAIFLWSYLLFTAPCSVPWRHPSFRGAAVASYLVFVGWLPWLPVLLHQRKLVQANYWTKPVTLWSLSQIPYQMFIEPQPVIGTSGEMLVPAVLTIGFLLAALWKPKARQYYVFCAAVAPFGLGVALSVVDTKVVTYRYFLFAHLFILTCLAVVVWRLPHTVQRHSIGAIVLAVFCLSYVGYWGSLDLPSQPGAQQAADYVTVRRKAGEPIVVSHPLIYFPFHYYLGNRSNCLLLGALEGLVHYDGLAVLAANELVTADELDTISDQRIWLVTAVGPGCSWSVPTPKHWIAESEKRFSEIFVVQGDVLLQCQIVVTEYRVTKPESMSTIKPVSVSEREAVPRTETRRSTPRDRTPGKAFPHL